MNEEEYEKCLLKKIEDIKLALQWYISANQKLTKELEYFKNAYENRVDKTIKLEKENEELKQKLILMENTGKLVKNKRDNKIGVILREFETGQIQVLERIYPFIINTHDGWKTLEISEEEYNEKYRK